jgi:hypothetical protein
MLKLKFKRLKSKNKNFLKKKKIIFLKDSELYNNSLIKVVHLKFKKYNELRVFSGGKSDRYLMLVLNSKYNNIKDYMNNFYFIAIKNDQ